MRTAILVVAVIGAGVAAAQDSRVAEIEAARDRKAAVLTPDEPSKVEKQLLYVKDARLLERITAGIAGVRAKIGGMVTGGGFGFGPEYLRSDFLNGEMLLRGAAQISTRGYQKFEVETGFPGFYRDKLFAELFAVHHNYGGIPYFGPGPDSAKTGRSSFRLEDTAFDGTFGVRPIPRLRVGASGGLLLVNTGPGSDERFVSTEKIYSPALAPGIDRQANFTRFGGFAQYDYRDNPKGPRAGGNYMFRYDAYTDKTLNRHDFQRIDMEVQQYFPFYNQRRVFALRGKSVLTFHDSTQVVPFYLQAVLGGSDDLRGFRPFRFYDENLLVMNAEYRWETFSGMDMALFVDGGKVFPTRSRLNFKDLEGSAGFGLRFNARNAVFMRIDVGFSHEGFQVWLKFNNVFTEKPFGTSSTQSIF